MLTVVLGVSKGMRNQRQGIQSVDVDLEYCCCAIQVQEGVHGVTIEECQAALQNHNWNVEKAVNYLKVRIFS